MRFACLSFEKRAIAQLSIKGDDSMRELCQLLFLETGGYSIRPLDDSDGKIEFELLHGSIAKKHKMHKCHDMVEATLRDFLKPVTFDEGTDLILRNHYKEMFCGEYDFGEYYISHVCIRPGYISISVNNSGGFIEVFHLSPVKPESHLELAIKAPNINGIIETYTVVMDIRRSQTPGDFYGETLVKEPHGIDGERSIILERGNWLKEIGQGFGLDSGSWIPAYVVENR